MSKAIENPAPRVAISDEEQPQASETNSVSNMADTTKVVSISNWNDYSDFKKLSDEDKLRIMIGLEQACRLYLPPENPLFELFSVCVEYNNPERRAELYGLVEAEDESDTFALFDVEENESVSISGKEFIPLNGPSRSISAAGLVKVLIQLDVKIDGEEFEVNNLLYPWDFERAHNRDTYDITRSYVSLGEHGCVTFFYIALQCAVQATLEASLRTPNGRPLNVYGTIVAYYGNFHYRCKPNEKEYYRVTLFKRSRKKPAFLKDGTIQLSRCVVAVPAESSLIIEAHLWESDTDVEILGDTLDFPAKLKDSSNGCIKGQGCSLDMKADWHCDESI